MVSPTRQLGTLMGVTGAGLQGGSISLPLRDALPTVHVAAILRLESS